MLKPIAVDGMTLEIMPSLITDEISATIVISSLPQTKERCEGFGIFAQGTSVSVSNIIVPNVSATTPDPTIYNEEIAPTAEKTKVENKLVLREGDETAIINAVPVIPGSPPTNYPVSFKIRISNSGQNSVKAA